LTSLYSAQDDGVDLRLRQFITGVSLDLALSACMFRGGLLLALGLFTICSPLAAQQAKHSGITKHRAAVPAIAPLDGVSKLSIYRPNVTGASKSILLQSGPVRAWSDGGQLVSENAFVQIGMAPLELFPVSYLAPSETGAAPASASTRRITAAQNLSSGNFGADGKDLPSGMLDSPLSHVYVTGEIGFMYGQWSGKGSGDYVGSYIWGQAGNDKFQITAGGSFENWNGSSPKLRGYQFSR
jgi:hypothetical protein